MPRSCRRVSNMHCVRALATRMPRSCRRVSRMCAGFAVGTVVLGGRARVVGFGGGFGFEQVVVCIWVSCQHDRALQLMAISATTRGRPMATLQNHRGQRLVDAAGQEIKAGSDRGVVVGSKSGRPRELARVHFSNIEPRLHLSRFAVLTNVDLVPSARPALASVEKRKVSKLGSCAGSGREA